MGKRVLPHNLEAEQAVLGSILLDNRCLLEVLETQNRDDFYSTRHKLILEAMIRLEDSNKTVDILTLTDELKKADKLEKSGGAGYIAKLVESVVSPSNITEHLNIIRNKSRLRSLIKSSNEILDSAYKESDDADKLLDVAEQKIFHIAQTRQSREFFPIGEIVHDTMDNIARRRQDKRNVSGQPTGFVELDSNTQGMHPGDLTILAARPSIGKTAFSLCIANHLAVKEKIPVAFFSMEMTAAQLNERLLAINSMIDLKNIRAGTLSNKDLDKLMKATAQIYEAPLIIDSSNPLSIFDLRAKARRIKQRYSDLGLIIVDYLQLMEGSRRYSNNRQQEITEISRSLKALAGELNAPVIALSQLSRLIEQRKGKEKRPILSDLRESGAIEQDADVVLFIHRPAFSDPNLASVPDKTDDTVKIVIGKQRNGPAGIDIPMIFIKHCAKFENMATHYSE